MSSTPTPHRRDVTYHRADVPDLPSRAEWPYSVCAGSHATRLTFADVRAIADGSDYPEDVAR